MNNPWQLRSLSILCIMMGVTRAFFSFIPWESNRLELEFVALLIDLGTLGGLCTFYFPRVEPLGSVGFLGFITAFSGLAIITGVDGQAFGVDVYGLGIVIIGLGLLIFSLALLIAKLARLAAVFWISMVAVQMIAVAVSMGEIGFIATGVLYGLGFAALGWAILNDHREGI
ncbi:MAG: hypothetical protein AAF850_05635 [Pseudomonadota bacterium]